MGETRLQWCKEQADEVKEIMVENYNKAVEREGKLGELELRSDDLLSKSKNFTKSAAKVSQQTRWENIKMKVAIGGVVTLLALVIIAVIIWYSVRDDRGKQTQLPPSVTPGN
ncbi:vesicle-associated membrane protein 5-like [Acipenser oxyrinchus oxyrinchus]|uniref:Vesicle-associated membrane protein 5-like n=1 Tax=Acipenser oxyrinchus oxyrinchus TaxID=40147 RepID=A0AAD8CP44_ACIOX|nr:vesicle-associated membrane protein 5-like [Acipenser oxyrinchus oxyrinchus]